MYLELKRLVHAMNDTTSCILLLFILDSILLIMIFVLLISCLGYTTSIPVRCKTTVLSYVHLLGYNELGNQFCFLFPFLTIDYYLVGSICMTYFCFTNSIVSLQGFVSFAPIVLISLLLDSVLLDVFNT